MKSKLKNIFRPIYYFFLDNLYSLKALWGGGITPDFIIIGTQKGGTTSLFHYLSQHSQIVGASKKEVHYFDHNYTRGIDWYKAHFLKASKIKKQNPDVMAVEGSPYYVYHPHAPLRIAKELPDIKLILILRKPSQRALSHYKHNIARGKYSEEYTFEKVLKIEELELQREKEKLKQDIKYSSNIHDIFSLKDRGVYVEQLKNYYRFFKKEQILILSAENLFQNPQQEMEKVCDFLNIKKIKFFTDKVYNKNKLIVSVEKNLLEALDEYYEPYNQELFQLIGEEFNW